MGFRIEISRPGKDVKNPEIVAQTQREDIITRALLASLLAIAAR